MVLLQFVNLASDGLEAFAHGGKFGHDPFQLCIYDVEMFVSRVLAPLEVQQRVLRILRFGFLYAQCVSALFSITTWNTLSTEKL